MTAQDGTARQAVEHLLLELPHQEAIRPDGTDVSFQTAWEIRAFALAVAAHQNGEYDWTQFQEALVGAITRWEQAQGTTPYRYYDRWLEALESLLAARGLLDVADVEERTRVVLTTPRDTGHHRAHREPVAVDAARA